MCAGAGTSLTSRYEWAQCAKPGGTAGSFLSQHDMLGQFYFVPAGSFVPTLQLEKCEIHKVCLHFPNFDLKQNLSAVTLANFVQVITEMLPCAIIEMIFFKRLERMD